MEVSYFNPRPIRISRAETTTDGAVTKVFVELRDTGYPGCTYRLAYDPESDRLQGTYFQASLHQTFDVAFERVN